MRRALHCIMETVLEKKTVRVCVFSVILSLVLAGIDQFTKYLAVEHLKPVSTVSLLKFGDTEWLNLTYCENTGMSFSLLEGQTVLLIVMPILLIGLIEWYVFSGRAKRTDQIIAAATVAGGGFGNLIDRAFQGYVVDFIDFRIINFAVFNFADICAVCGGIYFCILLIADEIREEREKKAANEAADIADDAETAEEDSPADINEVPDEQPGEQSDENA